MRKTIVYIAFFLTPALLLAQADFSANVTKGCGPLTVQFTDMSTGAVGWYWDFGNGNQSTQQNPSAIYSSPGYYDVQLTIGDRFGNKYTKQVKQFIQVFTPPLPYFSASKKKLCPNDTLTFFNLSTPGDAAITSYYWDFGDGNSATDVSPVHSFKNPSYRNITLIAKDNNGCFGVKKFTSYIQVWTPPTADFSLDTTLSCNVPTKVTFKSNVFPGGMKHQWDFGNGNVSILENPVELYTKFGRYSVKLVVTDANGCKGTKLVNDAVVIDKIVLNFTAQKPNVCDTSTPVVFTNSSNIYNGYSWLWDFGDGTTDNNFAPVHKYANFGVYSVTLKATGPNCVAVFKRSNLIRVSRNPPLKIRVNDTDACHIPFKLMFYPNTSVTASVAWDFGDKSTGSGTNISHQYFKDDTFRVYAVATEINGCTSKDSIDVSMNFLSTIPEGNIGGCAPFNLLLKSTICETTAPLVSEKWYMGKSEIASGNTLKYYFPDTGKYKIRYVGTSSKGCVDSPEYTIKVGLKSNPSFYADTNTLCIGNQVHLTNTTPDNLKGLQFRWLTSEGGKSEDRHFTTSFRSTQGYVNVTLIAEHNGCTDTMVKKDSIFVNFPRVGAAFPRLTCFLPDSFPVMNTTTTYSKFRWSANPSELRKNNDTMWLTTKNKNYDLKLYAKNDNTGCEDSFVYKIQLTVNMPGAGAAFKLIDTCLPASAEIFDLSSTGSEIFWKIGNDTNKITAAKLSQVFADYGTYKFQRIALNRGEFQDCGDTHNIEIVIPKPDTRYSVSPQKGCTPLTLTLTDSGYFSGKKAYWKIGDSLVVSQGYQTAFTIKTAPKNGVQSIAFTAFDSLQRCSETEVEEIPVTGPLADVNHSFHYTCKNTRLDLSYTKISPENLVSTAWFVDDTLRSTAAVYSHFVSTVRWVKVVLVITDQNGCSSEIPKLIYTRVYKPQIKIHSDVKGAVCPPVTVSFTDSTYSFNNPLETWLWDFGDGATSTIKNPVHTYLNTGKYTVTLKVKNFVGCFATDSFPAFIDVKGPSGTIITGVDSGCVPWKVNFRTTAKELKDITWDFGDGTPGNGVNAQHIFSGKGKFRPSAILEDVAGCKIGLVSDTILHGLESATASIVQTSFCENAILNFADRSNYAGALPKNQWNIYGNSSSGNLFQYTPNKGQKDTLRFTAFGPLGCNDTLDFVPVKSAIALKEKHQTDTLCPGDLVTFTDISTSDTSIIFRKWVYDWIESTDSIAQFQAKNPGPNDLTLMLRNAYQCLEYITWPGATITGDTLQPKNPSLLVTSVLPDNQLEVRFNRSNDFDWKKYTVYDVSGGPPTVLKHIFNNNDTLIRIAGLDVLRKSYCLQIAAENFCKKESDRKQGIPHCQVNMVAIADTNVARLSWNNYQGNTLMATRLFRRELPFGEEIVIATPGIGENSFTDSNIKCKTDYSYRLESFFSNTVLTSSSDTAQALPIYKTSLRPPFISHVTVNNNADILLELDTGAGWQRTATSYVLEKQKGTGAFSFWEKVPKTNALLFSDPTASPSDSRHYYRVASADNCGGSSNWSDVSSPMLLEALTLASGEVQLQWNPYQYWPGGVQTYEVQVKLNTGDFIAVHRTSETQYTLTDAGKSCGSVPVFRIMALSNVNSGFADSTTQQQSLSNEVVVESKISIHIPNAFTPNHNGLNEIFKPEVVWAKNYRMFIYSRWGDKVAEIEGCGSGWDGNWEGEPAPSGCYAYRLELVAADGKRSYHTGNVILLR